MYSNLMLRQLSSCFSQLQFLTLSKRNLQVSMYNDDVFVFSFHLLCCHAIYPRYGFFQDKIKLRLFTRLKNLKKLVLEIKTKDDESLLLFTPLIKACPYLQIFVFKVRVFLVIAHSYIYREREVKKFSLSFYLGMLPHTYNLSLYIDQI
jgi:hypothetical protein